MKKVVLLFVFFTIVIVPFAFCQIAEIIDIKGEVEIRKPGAIYWQVAQLHMLLAPNSQVKTARASECTLAFDEDLKNIVTIKANSLITIENVRPGKIFLPEGRVFSLIEQLSKYEEFIIRTPTAIAGARGTGWSTGAWEDGTDVKCFEDDVFVRGLDQQGNVTGEQDLFSGFGLGVGRDGGIGDPFGLTNRDRSEWRDFKDNAEDRRQDRERGRRGSREGRAGADRGFGDVDDIRDTDTLDDLRDEKRQDFKDSWFEDFREEWDISSGQSVGT
jgi:hypothetical protein